MPASRPEPARRLVDLLDTLPPDERRELTAWLLSVLGPGRSRGLAPVQLPPWPSWASARRVASTLTSGADSQLVTVRLPAEQHTQLRTWCEDHGFTMAAVIRGLIERFLEAQAEPGDPPPAGPSRPAPPD